MDNGADDKCPSCGEWTPRAFDRYGGLYCDGTEMDYCTCDYQGDENEDFDEQDAIRFAA